MTHYLDFEKPLAEIEGKAEELRALQSAPRPRPVRRRRRARTGLRKGRVLQTFCRLCLPCPPVALTVPPLYPCKPL